MIKKWEELGARVWIDQHTASGATRFGNGDDGVGVTLSEETCLVPDERDQRHWAYCKPKNTGRLVLEISGRYVDDVRRRWADGKKQRLENVLGSFLMGLRKSIANEQDCRLDDECEARQRRRAEQVRHDREQRQKQLEQRRENLEACADSWRKSQEIRQYLGALEATFANNVLRPTDPEGFPEWLSWAKWYADAIDPLTPTPDREEYLKPPTNLKVQELDLTRTTKTIVESLGRSVLDASADRRECPHLGRRVHHGRTGSRPPRPGAAAAGSAATAPAAPADPRR